MLPSIESASFLLFCLPSLVFASPYPLASSVRSRKRYEVRSGATIQGIKLLKSASLVNRILTSDLNVAPYFAAPSSPMVPLLITLMHAHHSDISLVKRDTFRPVSCNGYPGLDANAEPWVPKASHCVPAESPQHYVVECFSQSLYAASLLANVLSGTDHPLNEVISSTQIIRDSCNPTEICVQIDNGIVRSGYPALQQAICVSTDDYARIATSNDEKVSSSGSYQVPAPPGVYLADAVLTGSTMTTKLEAKSLGLHALKNLGTVNHVPHYAGVASGSAQCENCSLVQLQPVPEGVDLLAADVVIDGGGGTGMLFLTTFS